MKGMITKKGLDNEDVFALISEDKRQVSIHVGIPECEKFTVIKNYSSVDEYHERIQDDIEDFIISHRNTTFTIAASEEEVTEEEVVNDSWGAIFNDAKDGLKSKFKR
jgi:hypothetical protein